MEDIGKRLQAQGDDCVAKFQEFAEFRFQWLNDALEEAIQKFSKERTGSFPRTPKLTRRKGRKKEEDGSISRKSSVSKKIKLEENSSELILKSESKVVLHDCAAQYKSEEVTSSESEIAKAIVSNENYPNPTNTNEESLSETNNKIERFSISRKSLRKSTRLSYINQQRNSIIAHLKPSERVSSALYHRRVSLRDRTRELQRRSIIQIDESLKPEKITSTSENSAVSNTPPKILQPSSKENIDVVSPEEIKLGKTVIKHCVPTSGKSVPSVCNDSKAEIISNTPSPQYPVKKIKVKQTPSLSGKLNYTPNYTRSQQIIATSTNNLGAKKAKRVPSTSKHSYVNPITKKGSLTPSVKNTNSFVMSAPSLKRHSPRINIKEREGLEEIKKKLKRKSDISRKRDELLQQKIEEHRRKREERMRRVKEAQEQKAREIEEQLRQLEKERIERQNALEKNREQKMKQVTIKRSLRNKQKKETEERRRKEEEARKAKLKEQEEEHKRYQLMQERKKEFELQQKRLALKEKEQREIEEKKEQQRLKEERDRQKEQERIAREKAELERIQEKERIAREEMEMKIIRAQQEKQNNQTDPLTRVQESTTNQLNSTFVKEESDHDRSQIQSYMITPDRPKPKKQYPMSSDNYDIADLHSGDSTDDDSNPRKPIPHWAKGNALIISIIQQTKNPPNLDKIFTNLEVPDLCEIFKSKNRRYIKRTSSAVWTSPIMKHNSSINYMN